MKEEEGKWNVDILPKVNPELTTLFNQIIWEIMYSSS